MGVSTLTLKQGLGEERKAVDRQKRAKRKYRDISVGNIVQFGRMKISVKSPRKTLEEEKEEKERRGRRKRRRR